MDHQINTKKLPINFYEERQLFFHLLVSSDKAQQNFSDWFMNRASCPDSAHQSIAQNRHRQLKRTVKLHKKNQRKQKELTKPTRSQDQYKLIDKIPKRNAPVNSKTKGTPKVNSNEKTDSLNEDQILQELEDKYDLDKIFKQVNQEFRQADMIKNPNNLKFYPIDQEREFKPPLVYPINTKYDKLTVSLIPGLRSRIPKRIHPSKYGRYDLRARLKKLELYWSRKFPTFNQIMEALQNNTLKLDLHLHNAPRLDLKYCPVLEGSYSLFSSDSFSPYAGDISDSENSSLLPSSATPDTPSVTPPLIPMETQQSSKSVLESTSSSQSYSYMSWRIINLRHTSAHTPSFNRSPLEFTPFWYDDKNPLSFSGEMKMRPYSRAAQSQDDDSTDSIYSYLINSQSNSETRDDNSTNSLTNEDSNDSLTNEDSKDLRTNEGSTNSPTNEGSTDSRTNEDSKDSRNEDSKDSQTRNEDSIYSYSTNSQSTSESYKEKSQTPTDTQSSDQNSSPLSTYSSPIASSQTPSDSQTRSNSRSDESTSSNQGIFTSLKSFFWK